MYVDEIIDKMMEDHNHIAAVQQMHNDWHDGARHSLDHYMEIVSEIPDDDDATLSDLVDQLMSELCHGDYKYA